MWNLQNLKVIEEKNGDYQRLRVGRGEGRKSEISLISLQAPWDQM
jgi:hypothetical protein